MDPPPWRGVLHRGEKIGFTVSQTTPTDGFELQEDGRLQMLLGQDTAARIRTTARVDTSFTLTASSSRSTRARAQLR